jgi:1,4-alpha-glucan branching enzyme
MPDTHNNNSIKILEIDPWLKPFEQDFVLRMDKYKNTKKALLGELKSFDSFANGYLYFGFHQEDGGWYYREWAPAADALYLVGDFNNWNTQSHPLTRKENGCWEVFVPGTDTLKHMSLVKVRIHTHGAVFDRIPLYISRVVQDTASYDFAGQIWKPQCPYECKHSDFRIDRTKPLFIYEAHVGMAQEKEGVGTYKEFTENILPRVKAANYNAIQLMAIMEHPYYGSFGYQVSNFFAASSRFGTPEDLKELIDTAHSMGIAVLLDIIHSHASKNYAEGINRFDGTDHQFFHAGGKGEHPVWDSKLFNYAKHEVIHFLLSNIKFWMEEYHFDGFRFDGVTSMLYDHHGIGVDFTDYSKYFNMGTDIDAIAYLQFANELIHELRPDAVSIAEDMSGMPGMCLPIEYGGIGFDYRLAMGVPDFWVKALSKMSDDQWSMWGMWHELTTRRPQEKNIGYAESHDQAMVGDKTIIFWLADKEMYWNMTKLWGNMIIDRAISLHKLIRFVTVTLAGEGYLNFMGNEFGHPEWIDFPREGNGWSYKYARRQWSLLDDQSLRFEHLAIFDREMIDFMKSHSVLGAYDLRNLYVDEGGKTLAFIKGGLVFLFNFNPTMSFEGYPLPIDEAGDYRVVFSSDEERFGGHSRIAMDVVYSTKSLPERDNRDGVLIYSPSRTVLVLKKI